MISNDLIGAIKVIIAYGDIIAAVEVTVYDIFNAL